MRSLTAVLLLMGCATAAPAPAPDPVRRAPIALATSTTGLDVVGTGQEIGFGRAIDGVRPILGPVAARPCTTGPGEVLTTAGGIALHFPNGTFTGWRTLDARAGRLCGG